MGPGLQSVDMTRGLVFFDSLSGNPAKMATNLCPFRVSLTEAVSEFEADQSRVPSGLRQIEVVHGREVANCSGVHLKDNRSGLGRSA